MYINDVVQCKYQVGFPIGFPLREIARNDCFRNFIAQSCAMIANKEAIKYSRNCAEFHAAELLFHLKINNFNCDLHIDAAYKRMEISLVSSVYKF